MDFWNSKYLEFSLCIHFEWKVFLKNYLPHWFWFQLFSCLIVLWCEVASTLFLWSSSLESRLLNDFGGSCFILRGYCSSHIVACDSMKLILFLLVRVYPPSAHRGFIKSWLLEISQQPFLNFLSWVKEPFSSRAWLWPLLSEVELLLIHHHTGAKRLGWSPCFCSLSTARLSGSWVSALNLLLLSNSWKWLYRFSSPAVTYLFNILSHYYVFGVLNQKSKPVRRLSGGYSSSTLNIHWIDWCWSWSSNTLATWYKELTHFQLGVLKYLI